MKPRLRHLSIEKTRHGKSVVYFRRGQERRVRLPDPSSPQFRTAYDAAFEGNPLPYVRQMPPTKVALRRGRTKTALEQALRAAKGRAKHKGVPFDLTLTHLFELAEVQDYRCALTGIEFFTRSEQACRVAPFVPSIDRIVPRGGYVCGNVRLTVFAINAMMLDWGEDVFDQVASSYRYWKTKRHQSMVAPDIQCVAPQNKSSKNSAL